MENSNTCKDDITNEEMLKARELLKKKLGNIQTGGKGTVRRKKKVINPIIINSRKTPEEKEYYDAIEGLNKEINSLQGERYELWFKYLEDYMIDLGTEFKRKDFKKQSKFSVEWMAENYEDFFYDHLLSLVNNKYIFKDNYRFLKSEFSDNGYNYILGNIIHFKDVIIKKEYINNKEDSDEITDINKYFEVLNLDSNTIPSISEIKKAYLKKSTKVHPDKHPDEYDKYVALFQEVTNAQQTLLKYYYPKKYTRSELDIVEND